MPNFVGLTQYEVDEILKNQNHPVPENHSGLVWMIIRMVEHSEPSASRYIGRSHISSIVSHLLEYFHELERDVLLEVVFNKIMAFVSLVRSGKIGVVNGEKPLRAEGNDVASVQADHQGPAQS